MKNKRLNPWGSWLILLGIIVPAVAFFGALWQGHPDPSAFRLEEFGELNLVLIDGRRVFECEETGEILPMSEIPENLSEVEYMRFFHENVFIVGRVETRVVHVIAGGIAVVAAGLVICFRRKA